MTKTKTVCFVLLISLFLVHGAGRMYAASTADEVRIFIFAGQSNMEGADTNKSEIDRHPPFRGAAQKQPDVRYSYNFGPDKSSDGWIAMQPVGRLFGPEMTFARLLKQHVDYPIAVIKDAWGGTTLVHDWHPAGPEKGRKLYARLMRQVRDRLKELDARGVKYRIEAMMWHQGENDMFDGEGIETYEKNLRLFIQSIRKGFKQPELPFFIGQISTKGIWGIDNRRRVAKICVQQKAVVETDPNVYFVPTSHLGFKIGRGAGLHYHFGTLGQLQHGHAYAKSYLEAIGSPLESPDRSFRSDDLPRGKKVKLFILGGERNMEGEDAYVSQITDFDRYKKLGEDQDDVLFQYYLGGGVKQSHFWEPLGPAGFLSNFGPELSFGRLVKKHLKQNEVPAIYKFTHSGAQSIDWVPEGTDIPHRDLYRQFIEGIQKARRDLEKAGYKHDLAAVFWHCGENDRALHQSARPYAANLKKLIDGTRRDLSLPDLKWFISEQPVVPPEWAGKRTFLPINNDLKALARSDKNIHFVRTSHLPHRVVVFGTEGILALGEAMAQAWLRLGKSYPDPARFENAIKQFEARDRTDPPPEGAVLCIGSSSMRGWHSTIRKDLAPLQVIPRGFGGSNFNDLLYYTDRVVLPYKPRAILVYEGDNDVAQGITPQKIANTMRAFVLKVRRKLPDCRFYFLAVKPSISRWRIWPVMKETNTLLRGICGQDPRMTFVDIATPMVGSDGTPKKEIFLKDNLHMNRNGYEIWRDAVRPSLAKEFENE